jgi:hypothetical protein
VKLRAQRIFNQNALNVLRVARRLDKLHFR